MKYAETILRGLAVVVKTFFSVEVSQEEQLWFIEQLAHSLRESQFKNQTISEDQLAAMASDWEIQSELRQINREFAFTESDGLEKV